MVSHRTLTGRNPKCELHGTFADGHASPMHSVRQGKERFQNPVAFQHHPFIEIIRRCEVMFSIGLAYTKNNSRKLASGIAKWKERILNRFADDHQQAAREILRESNESSPAGTPPNVHSREPNLETFGREVDLANDTVLSGPVFVPSSNIRPALPGLIERSGVGIIRRRQTSRRTSRVRRVRYRARPFSKPAAERALLKIGQHASEGP